MEIAENFFLQAEKPESFDKKNQIIRDFIAKNKQNKIVLVTVRKNNFSTWLLFKNSNALQSFFLGFKISFPLR